MKRLLSFILTPLFFIFFGLILTVFHPIQVIVKNVFGSNAHDKSVTLLNFFLTKNLLTLGTKIQFNSFRKLPSDQPVLVISNHQSMWDIPPVIWKLNKKHPKYIAKASLARFIPSISYNLKYGGSVSIDRSKPEESIKRIKSFSTYIKENNFAICIYPEGTRSRDGIVKPFKLGGIEAILEIIPDILVVPIAIKNTGLIDNQGNFLKRIGINISFTMLKSRKIDSNNVENELEIIRQEIIQNIQR